jgi:hypothetical protein
MANLFQVQGFGALSEWNGQASRVAADQADQTIASLGSNSVELTDRIWTQTGTSNTVISDAAKTKSDASLLAGFKAAQAGYGSVLDGVGAEAQLLVNGKIVSGVLEFMPATDPSGYQSYTITFDNNSEPITSFDISLANSTPGCSLNLKGISVNGVDLVPSKGTNASSPGSFDLYVQWRRRQITGGTGR